MSNEVVIEIGGTHCFQLKGKKNVLESKIIKDLGDRYLCFIKDIDAYYHITKEGSVIVYSVAGSSAPIQVNKDGIWLLDVDLEDHTTFLFNGEPVVSESGFMVSDMVVGSNFQIILNGNTAVPKINNVATAEYRIEEEY